MAKFLTVKEVAKMLQLHENTVYLYVEQKKIPHIKLGGAVRFEKEALLEWFKNRMGNQPVPGGT